MREMMDLQVWKQRRGEMQREVEQNRLERELRDSRKRSGSIFRVRLFPKKRVEEVGHPTAREVLPNLSSEGPVSREESNGVGPRCSAAEERKVW